MPEIEIEVVNEDKSDFNEKDAFIDLDHYRRLVHTYVDMVCIFDCLCFLRK